MKKLYVAVATIMLAFSSPVIAGDAASETPGPSAQRLDQEVVGNAYNCPGSVNFNAAKAKVC